MNTLNRLMDAAQKNCEPQTLEALKVRLGVSRQSMYDWRAGNKAISDEHLARLIELAGGDPADAIAVRREGAKSDHERAMWRSLARRLGAAAAVSAVALLGYGFLDQSAHETIQSAAILNVVGTMHYAKWAVLSAAAAWALHHALSRSTGGRRDTSPTVLA